MTLQAKEVTATTPSASTTDIPPKEVKREWHYAPLGGSLASRLVGATEFEKISDWAEHHARMESFLSMSQNGQLQLLRTETYGHSLFHGHSGRVDVYIER